MNLIIFITILILLQGVANFLDFGEKKSIVFEHTTDNLFFIYSSSPNTWNFYMLSKSNTDIKAN